MSNDEKKYLDEIEKVIENFGNIQRNFVLDKSGIRAIIKFIEDLEGHRPFFELDDPVVQKGKLAADRVIEELSKQLDTLKNIEPPANWLKFHESLTQSIEIQVEGYNEMALVFEDSDMEHITDGQEKVNQGFNLLEAGAREEE